MVSWFPHNASKRVILLIYLNAKYIIRNNSIITIKNVWCVCSKLSSQLQTLLFTELCNHYNIYVGEITVSFTNTHPGHFMEEPESNL